MSWWFYELVVVGFGFRARVGFRLRSTLRFRVRLVLSSFRFRV